MTRSTLSALNRAEIVKPNTASVWLVALEFQGGTIYTATGDKDFDFDGETYLADGKILGISGISERGDGSQDPIEITLNGLDPDLVARFDEDDWHFSITKVFQLFLDEEWIEIDDPHDHGAYYMSHLLERIGEGEGSFTLTVENALWSEGQRVDAVLCDPNLHRRRSSGDSFWDNVLKIIDREVVWAGFVGKSSSPAGSGGSIGSAIVIPFSSDPLNSAGGRTTYFPSGTA